MQILEREFDKVELVAENPEEVKLLRNMWVNGIFRDSFDSFEREDASLIIGARSTDECRLDLHRPEYPLDIDTMMEVMSSPRHFRHSGKVLYQLLYDLIQRLENIEQKLGVKQ